MADEATNKQGTEQVGQTTDAKQDAQMTGAVPGEKADNARTFSQAEVDAIIKERLDRAERKATEKAAEAAAAAEANALAEQGKYKELYETVVAERDDLKPYKDRFEALAGERRAELLAETAKWPAEVKALLPGEDADVTVLGEAVTKARKLVEALTAKAEAAPGQGVTPKPAGQGSKQDAAVQQAYAARVRNF